MKIKLNMHELRDLITPQQVVEKVVNTIGTPIILTGEQCYNCWRNCNTPRMLDWESTPTKDIWNKFAANINMALKRH